MVDTLSASLVVAVGATIVSLSSVVVRVMKTYLHPKVTSQPKEPQRSASVLVEIDGKRTRFEMPADEAARLLQKQSI